MKLKLKLLFSTLLLLSVSTLVNAEVKVAVFDHQEAIMGTKSAKKSIQELQEKAEYTQLITQIESFQADLKTLNKEAETEGMTWSTERVNEQREKMEYVQAQLQLAAKKIQAENTALGNKILQEMQGKLEAALKKIVTAEGIDIVLRKQVTYFQTPSVDITQKVIEVMDKAK